jgi:phospholipid transport system substrate-binding protein
LFAVLLAGLVLGTSLQAAPAAQPTPHALVEQVTERVLAIIEDAKDDEQPDQEQFYREVDAAIDPLVDFDSFARSVMGRYASKRAYDALPDAAAKQAFRARVTRFSRQFRDGLVKTYASGLLSFDGERVVVEPPRADFDPAVESNVYVVQRIYGQREQPYVIQYKMRKDRDGAWKLRNVVLEGINLGLTYRNQFAAAVDLYNGDVDKAVDNWTVEPGTPKNGAVAADDEADID